MDFMLIHVLSQDQCPYLPVFDIFYRCYPYKLFLGKEGRSAVENILETFHVLNGAQVSKEISVKNKIEDKNSINVGIKYANEETVLTVSKNNNKKKKKETWN